MSDAPRHSYNLRERNPKRKHSPEESSVKTKRFRTFSYIEALPNEILLQIFSYLSVNDLYYNVRRVCSRWQQLSMLSPSWRRVSAGNNIPTEDLHNWIQFSPVIRHIQISDRTDADFILEAVSKHLTKLKSITINNCWGSPQKICIRSQTLCKLMTKCEKLEEITFGKVKIRSLKFFKIMAERKNYDTAVHLVYIGPLSPKQYNMLRETYLGELYTEMLERSD